jgi:hypothetical protein
MSKHHSLYLSQIKSYIFPTPYTPPPASLSLSPSQKHRPMDPTDMPVNSLRYELIKLMLSLDSNIKRCVSEFLFTLCHEDGKYSLSLCML